MAKELITLELIIVLYIIDSNTHNHVDGVTNLDQ